MTLRSPAARVRYALYIALILASIALGAALFGWAVDATASLVLRAREIEGGRGPPDVWCCDPIYGRGGLAAGQVN